MHPARKVRTLSPRVKQALRAYLSGAVKTKKEASALAGLHPMYLQMVDKSAVAQEYAASFDGKVEGQALDVNKIIARLAKDAISTVETIMRNAESPAVRLKAAVDILDRNPVTSKVQKHQVESFTMGNKDAKAIAEALVESANLSQVFPEAMQGNFIRIGENKPMEKRNED